MGFVTLPFNGVVAAGGEKTLASKRLTFPYRIHKLISSFALGQDRTMQVRFFNAKDNQAPASGLPSGLDLLNIYGESAFLVGDEDTKTSLFEALVPEGGTYMKVYARNTDGFEHTIDCQVVIERLPAGVKPNPGEVVLGG